LTSHQNIVNRFHQFGKIGLVERLLYVGFYHFTAGCGDVASALLLKSAKILSHKFFILTCHLVNFPRS